MWSACLAALLLPLDATLTEIVAPRGRTFSDVSAIGPKGELSITFNDDPSHLYISRDGKLSKIRPLTNLEAGLVEGPTPWLNSCRFLPDGSIYGTLETSTSGAAIHTYARPFLIQKDKMRPVPLPAKYQDWDGIAVVGAKPDGSLLLDMYENGGWRNAEVPEVDRSRLIWVNQGRLVEDLGPASHPVLSRSGEVAGVTFEIERSPTEEGAFVARPIASLWRSGKRRPIAEGFPLAILDDGGIVILSEEALSTPYAVTLEARPSVIARIARAGQLTDFQFPGKPKFMHSLALDHTGRGIVIGTDAPEAAPSIRAFNSSAFREIKLPFAAERFRLIGQWENTFLIAAAPDQITEFRYFKFSLP